MDIGTPERYLQASWDILEGRVADAGASRPRPACFVAADAEVAAGAAVGPRAVVSAGCRVGAGAEIRDSVLLDGCAVGEGARVERLDPRPRRRGRAGRRSSTARWSAEMKESRA